MEHAPYRGVVYRAISPSGASYIGKSKHGVAYRRKSHETYAATGSRLPFSCALRKYPPSDWVWEILYMSDDDAALLAAEIELIAQYRAAGARLYNVTEGGDGRIGAYTSGPDNPLYGRVMTESQKQKYQNLWTDERRAATADRMRKRVVSPETRAKLAEAMRRRQASKRKEPR